MRSADTTSDSPPLALQLLQPLHLGRQQTGKLLLPVEVRRLADPGLPADLRNWGPVFVLLDDERFLRVRKLQCLYRDSAPLPARKA